MTTNEIIGTSITGLVLAVGVTAYVHTTFAKDNEVTEDIRRVEESAAAQIGQEAKFIQRVHRYDVFESRVKNAQRYIEYLESVDADPARLEDARAELDYWVSEQRLARDELTKGVK